LEIAGRRWQICLPRTRDPAAGRDDDAREVLDLIAAHGRRGHIPTRRDRKVQRSVDPALYRRRTLVERFFNKIKYFRKVAARFAKTAKNEPATLLNASTRLRMCHRECAS